MYSTLPTLNNKKITAMFYVHLFLKAMYRKEEINVVFPKSAAAYAWQFEVLKLRKAVASYVSRRSEEEKKHGQRSKTAIVTEMNSERERLTGSMLKSILVNSAITTARKLIIL